MSGLDGAWVGVQVRANREQSVADQLAMHGYDAFLPTTPARCPAPHPRRLPLFPGYVFCRYKLTCDVRIVQIPGVSRIVAAGRTPLTLAEEEIEAVRLIVVSGRPTEPCPFLTVGQRVRVRTGPLSGVEGILVTVKNNGRVLVSITLLRRSVLVDISASELASIHDAADPYLDRPAGMPGRVA